MGRTMTVALVAAMLLALTAGAALADTIDCSTDPWTPEQNTPEECYGTEGNDTMHGTPGQDLMDARAGKDTLNGYDGNDIINAQDGLEDQVDCGTGSADYAFFDVGLDTVRNCEGRSSPDYSPEERQVCTPPWSYEVRSPRGYLPLTCTIGTEGNDVLVGSDDPVVFDTIWGLGGDDTLKGRAGWDGLEGGPGKDTLYGHKASDFLFGDESSQSQPNPDADRLDGGDGDDTIFAWDRVRDTISCGPGQPDRVQADRDIDVVPRDCERVRWSTENDFHWARWIMRRK
jgi:Ca2+-binding RTX toxin-like protein